MSNLDYVIIICIAFFGSLGSGILGWLKSGAKFEIKIFSASIWSAIISAAITALSYTSTSSLTTQILITAFLTGAGIDVLNNRSQQIVSSLTNTSKLLTPSNEHTKSIVIQPKLPL